MNTSTRRGIAYPNPITRGDSADVARDTKALIDAVELDVVFSQGTHAARPAAGVGAPAATGGGRLYWETDTVALFYDTGSAWVNVTALAIGAGAILNAMLADDSVDQRVLGPLAVGTPELIDAAVTAAKIADALKPSAGAGGATEALRALGNTAAKAAAGNDNRFPIKTGRINSDASVAAGGGFTVVHNGGGQYTVSYANVGAIPVINVVQIGGTITLQSRSATSFTVQCQGGAVGNFDFTMFLPF